MKVVVYTLNEDGTVPEYVIDGGYFPHSNENFSPQDWDLVGVAQDNAPGTVFSNQQSLKDYLISIGSDSWSDQYNNPINIDDAVSNFWTKLS